MALFGSLYLAACAAPPAGDAAAGPELVLEKPRAHLLPGTGVIYFELHNSGPADRLLRVETPFAQAVESHETLEEDGVMRMRPRPEGFEIPAGGVLKLESSGKHLMLVNPDESLKDATALPVTLFFKHGEPLEAEIPILPPGGSGSV
jgi:copper(I)-binding protein